MNRISTSISGTSAGIRLPHGPRASDEADGNTGRSQPGFFRITGTKYFVPYRSQAQNISYPADHRQKIFRTLPQMAWGGEVFSSDIMWWLGDWTRLILHQLPLPRKSLKRGKDILVSTSWWEVANHIRYGIRFTVRILGGITHYLSLIPLTLERSKDRLSLVYPP